LQRSLKRFRVSGLKLAAKAPGRGIEGKWYCCNYTCFVKRCKNCTASKVEIPKARKNLPGIFLATRN